MSGNARATNNLTATSSAHQSSKRQTFAENKHDGAVGNPACSDRKTEEYDLAERDRMQDLPAPSHRTVCGGGRREPREHRRNKRTPKASVQLQQAATMSDQRKQSDIRPGA